MPTEQPNGKTIKLVKLVGAIVACVVGLAGLATIGVRCSMNEAKQSGDIIQLRKELDTIKPDIAYQHDLLIEIKTKLDYVFPRAQQAWQESLRIQAIPDTTR